MTNKKNEVDVALQAYTKRAKVLLEFTEKHSSIFVEQIVLQENKNQAERLLKTTSREAKEGAENKQFVVLFTPKWRKWYDTEAVYKAADPKQRKLIDEKCLVQTLDKKKFEDLIKSEELPRELKQIGFKEEEMTAAITIKVKEEE